MALAEKLTVRVLYLPPVVYQRVQETMEARRAEREANPQVFRRYAESLLRTVTEQEE
jgi:hypothetical protein